MRATVKRDLHTTIRAPNVDPEGRRKPQIFIFRDWINDPE
jgi:hypothetical protein